MNHSVRIRGTVKLIEREPRIFGLIEGDDLRDYMFIPSYLREPLLFLSLTINATVEFTPRSTMRGMRAWNISVLSTTPEASHRGEEAPIQRP